MILDIGCGNTPKGNVNCDLFIRDTETHRTDILNDYTIKTKNIPNFVVCDASHLPFGDGVFDLVLSYHTIEHVKTPIKMIKEMVRVSNNRVKIVCPHRFGNSFQSSLKDWVWCKQHHINNFTFTWFYDVINKLGFRCEVTETNSLFIPTNFFYIVKFPSEITVKIRKHEKNLKSC